MTDVLADGMIDVGVDILTEFTLDISFDILTDVMIGVDVDMLSGDIEMIAMDDTPAITLEFVVEIAYAGDVLTDVSTVLITDVVTVIIGVVGMFVDENASGLAVKMTPLEFTLPAP